MELIEQFNVVIRHATRRIKVASKLSAEVERRVSRDRIFGFGTGGVLPLEDGSGVGGYWYAALSMDEPPKIHGGVGNYRYFACPLREGEPFEYSKGANFRATKGWSFSELETIDAVSLVADLQTSFNKLVDFVNLTVSPPTISDFLAQLKAGCDAYDDKYGSYPESCLEGEALWEFLRRRFVGEAEPVDEFAIPRLTD